MQYWKLYDQIPVKDERGKPLTDAEGNKVYRSVQLDKPKVFSAVVFNAEQIDGLPPLEVKAPDWDRPERAESVLQASGVEIRHDQADRAFYRPATDRIHLPPKGQFDSAEIASLMIGDQLGIGHDPGQHAACVRSWVEVLKEYPREILRASRDADKITAYVMDLEKDRAPAAIEKLPQIERPAAPEVARKAPAPQRARIAGGRER